MNGMMDIIKATRLYLRHNRYELTYLLLNDPFEVPSLEEIEQVVDGNPYLYKINEYTKS
jgi:hypothetical protein